MERWKDKLELVKNAVGKGMEQAKEIAKDKYLKAKEKLSVYFFLDIMIYFFLIRIILLQVKHLK